MVLWKQARPSAMSTDLLVRFGEWAAPVVRRETFSLLAAVMGAEQMLPAAVDAGLRGQLSMTAEDVESKARAYYFASADFRRFIDEVWFGADCRDSPVDVYRAGVLWAMKIAAAP